MFVMYCYAKDLLALVRAETFFHILSRAVIVQDKDFVFTVRIDPDEDVALITFQCTHIKSCACFLHDIGDEDVPWARVSFLRNHAAIHAHCRLTGTPGRDDNDPWAQIS